MKNNYTKMERRKTDRRSQDRTFAIGLHLPKDMYQAIYAIAAKRGCSSSHVVRIAVEEWLAARQHKSNQ